MKIASPNPPYCSACFQAKHGMRHVDFEAFYDGPVVDPGNGMKQSIDDLVICEECLKAAGALVGLVADEEAATELQKLRTEVGQLRALRARNARKIQAVEKALAPA